MPDVAQFWLFRSLNKRESGWNFWGGLASPPQSPRLREANPSPPGEPLGHKNTTKCCIRGTGLSRLKWPAQEGTVVPHVLWSKEAVRSWSWSCLWMNCSVHYSPDRSLQPRQPSISYVVLRSVLGAYHDGARGFGGGPGRRDPPGNFSHCHFHLQVKNIEFRQQPARCSCQLTLLKLL